MYFIQNNHRFLEVREHISHHILTLSSKNYVGVESIARDKDDWRIIKSPTRILQVGVRWILTPTCLRESKEVESTVEGAAVNVMLVGWFSVLHCM